MIVLTVSIAVFLIYLICERLAVSRWRRSIPLVITVTGTRGKSSVTRLLACICRKDGRKVLAKTTGSAATLIWPDGAETEIRRRGPASIIEQKTLLRNAARRQVDCVVAEVMSIHPENHLVESCQILKPDIVAITNTWPDHLDAMGQTEGETARCLSLDIPDYATVFAAESACKPVLETAAANAGAKLIAVPHNRSKSTLDSIPGPAGMEFADNVELAYAVAKHIGVKDEVIRAGLTAARKDIGAFTIWEWSTGDPARSFLVVNAFAANDLESTNRVLTKLREIIPTGTRPIAGLLNLRTDRGDRTVQWIDALKSGVADQFSRLYVTGGHASVVARRVRSAQILHGRSPEELMESVVPELNDGAILFGFGNMAGMGRKLVDYWNHTGVVHGV